MVKETINQIKCFHILGYPMCIILNNQSIINWFQVYTDWANHYLDKAKSKRNIKDLQSDLADGVLLSDLVETICE